ncbi:MAG: hypothetical protein JHC54_12830 [Acinetobacter sp.]|nr:hypothetical protein [Acinetobacter sp.]
MRHVPAHSNAVFVVLTCVDCHFLHIKIPISKNMVDLLHFVGFCPDHLSHPSVVGILLSDDFRIAAIRNIEVGLGMKRKHYKSIADWLIHIIIIRYWPGKNVGKFKVGDIVQFNWMAKTCIPSAIKDELGPKTVTSVIHYNDVSETVMFKNPDGGETGADAFWFEHVKQPSFSFTSAVGQGRSYSWNNKHFSHL